MSKKRKNIKNRKTSAPQDPGCGITYIKHDLTLPQTF